MTRSRPRLKSLTELWHPCVHLGVQHHALLGSRLVARPDEDSRRRAAIYRDMQHVSRDVDEVARPNGFAMLKLISGPKLQHVAAHHVERGLVVLVHMRLRAATRWQRHQAEPDHP